VDDVSDVENIQQVDDADGDLDGLKLSEMSLL
jgi:hypothetical protein